MGSGKGSQTIGYRYYLGLHMGLCRGPIDEIVEIRVGDQTAWKRGMSTEKPSRDEQLIMAIGAAGAKAFGVEWPAEDPGAITEITESGEYYIYAPQLFGGDSAEGGINGTLSVLMGEEDQPVHAKLAAMLGGIVPAFRGRATMFYDGLITSMNPYPKSWKVRRRRALKGWDTPVWNPGEARIELAAGEIHAMNPAHILYECCTNRDWGRGLPSTELDLESFEAASATFYAEGFGLCFEWKRQDEIQSFITLVLDHVGARLYEDQRTSLLTLKPIRQDYDVDTLPHFTPDTGLLGIEEDDTPSQQAGWNEVIVRYKRPQDGKSGQVRIQNLASVQSGGGRHTITKEYPALPTPELALRVGQRDLIAHSGLLKRFKLRFDRRARQIQTGSAFKVSHPGRGISNYVLRAARVERDNATNGELVVLAIQDQLSLPTATFVDTQEPPAEPSRNPEPIVQRHVFEAPYIALARAMDADLLAQVDSTSAFVAAVARRPQPFARNFLLATRLGGSGDFTARASAAFAATAVLESDFDADEVLAVFESIEGLDEVEVGAAAMLGDEILRVDAIDLEAGEVEFGRGCADSVPVNHAAGTRVWFLDGAVAGDPTDYGATTEVEVKLITETNLQILKPSLAATDDITLGQRQARPYPPGNVQINGEAFPAETVGTLEITWAGRNRHTQADQLVAFDEGHVIPEANTGYSIQIKRVDTDAVVFSRSGIPTLADGGIYRAKGYSVEEERDYRLEIWATRSGLDSREKVIHEFAVFGWGRTWGSHWGGSREPGVWIEKGAAPPVDPPIPGLDMEQIVVVEFSGTVPSDDLFTFTISFTPLGGTPHDETYALDASGVSTIEELAALLATPVLADFGPDVAVAHVGGRVTISTFTGQLGVSHYNNTADVEIITEQEAAPVTAGVTHRQTYDFYEMGEDTFGPVEVIGPTVSSKYAGAGTMALRLTVGAVTYDARKALGTGGSREFLILAQLPDFGAGATCSYHVPLAANSGDDLLARMRAHAGLAEFVQSIQFTTPWSAEVTWPAPRSGVSVTMKPNFDLAEDQYRYEQDNLPESMAPLKLLGKTNRRATPIYPDGAAQISTVTFNTGYTTSGPIQSIVLGQVYSIMLDDVTYSTEVEAGDVAGSPNFRDDIYERLKSLIEGDGYTVRLNTGVRSGGATYVRSMEIEAAAINVPFTVSAAANFGVDVTITRS